MTPFDPAAIDAFAFEDIGVVWAADVVTVRFGYRLEADEQTVVRCSERFEFPLPAVTIPAERVAAFERLLPHLGLVAGLSYYKLAAPPRVLVEVGEWSEAAIEDHRTILAKGLGEYCFVNGLDPELRPVFEFRSHALAPVPVAPVGLHGGPLVPVGGGKDSCVTVESLRAHGLRPTLITVNRYPVIADVIDDAGLPDLAVRRVLDPQIAELNANGARNGHVPATAIVSLAVCAAAALHGHGSVVMSNERSASEGNVAYRGVDINHQWSKSEEAEAILQRLVAGAAPDLGYFSLLRPLSELEIARRFARSCERYFDSFSSCNAAFRLDPTRRVSRWCGRCPKCQFVFLALATVLDRSVLEGIVGSDVFASSPREGFRALLGLTPWKPFECVGESLECRVAIAIVAERGHWRDHPDVAALIEELRSLGRMPSTAERDAVFAAQPSSSTPPAFAAMLDSNGIDGSDG